MKTNAELIKWLRDNSSGVYRPSNEAADRLADALYVIRGIITDLPQNNDWLNPELERAAKLLISLDAPPCSPCGGLGWIEEAGIPCPDCGGYGHLRRIQRKRTKGWRMPANTVSVCRPGKWGNPFKVGIDGDAQRCVELFRMDICHQNPRVGFDFEEIEQLRGKNLACFCAPGSPCHADVLLRLANS